MTPPRKKLCAALFGFSLHAATRVRASDRKALLRLCHYGDAIVVFSGGDPGSVPGAAWCSPNSAIIEV